MLISVAIPARAMESANTMCRLCMYESTIPGVAEAGHRAAEPRCAAAYYNRRIDIWHVHDEALRGLFPKIDCAAEMKIAPPIIWKTWTSQYSRPHKHEVHHLQRVMAVT